MDSVRFGRALGVGARAAAKSLATAVDAASSPSPSKASPRAEKAQAASANASSAPGPNLRPSTADVSQRISQVATQVQQASDGLNRGSKQFKQSVWSPVRRLSGVLWLEFTGVFFGLFAASAGTAAWKLRGAMHDTPATHDDHTRFLLAMAICLLFGYFCISSFVRAHRRERAK